MGFHVGRQLLLSGFLLVLLQVLTQSQARPQDVITGEETEVKVVIKEEGEGGGDDDDSSSEETVEDSDETRRRRREVDTDNPPSARAGIPGEQIVPILLQAVLPGSDAAGDRFARSVHFLENLESADSGETATEKNE